MADDPDHDAGAPPQGAAPVTSPGREAGGADRALDDEAARRHLRRRRTFRGHIVVDDDEPLPVFDAPADPLPASPAGPEGNAPQG